MKRYIIKIILIFIAIMCIFAWKEVEASNVSYYLSSVIGYTVKEPEELDLFEAINRKVLISRYMLAEKNETIKNVFPNWYYITEENREKLDVNRDSKINSNDLIKIERHISLLKNKNIREKYPEWIIYEEIQAETIEMQEKNVAIEVGKQKELNVIIEPTNAENKEVVWTSNNTNVVTVDSNGKITGISNGSAIVSAYLKENEKVKTACEVTVQTKVQRIVLNKTNIQLDVSGTKQDEIVATIEPATANVNTKLAYSLKANNGVASVDQNGIVTGNKSGSEVIVVSNADGIKAECSVTVKTSPTGISLNTTSANIDLSSTKNYTLKATINPSTADSNLRGITWTSSNTNIATVNSSNGVVTFKNGGTVTITAKTINGKTATCTFNISAINGLTLNKTSISLESGKTYKLAGTISAIGNVNKTIIWTSSNSNVAKVASDGTVTAVNGGTATITAKTVNGKVATCKVNTWKINSIALNKTSVTIDEGKTTNLIASISSSGNADKTVIWSSSNTSVALINSGGKITGIKAGTATITVKSKANNNVKKTCKVVVKNPYSVSSKTKAKSKNGDGYTQTIKLGTRTYRLYKQFSGSYANTHFSSTNAYSSSGTISSMGCGPTSLSIILSGYGKTNNPGNIGKKLTSSAKKLREKGQNYAPASLYNMSLVANNLGRKTVVHQGYNKDYNKVYEKMKNALSKGHQIVLYVGKGEGTSKDAWSKFTDSGYHFIAILAIDLDNDKVYVANPSKSSGWYSLSTVVKARGNSNGKMKGWLEVY